jgi:hypothetical protein
MPPLFVFEDEVLFFAGADFAFAVFDFVVVFDLDDALPILRKDAGTAFFRTFPALSDAAFE